MSASRADVCAVALADLFRGDGEIMASPMGTLPSIGARLAQATFAPDLALSADLALPYRAVFDVVWSGRRHVVMGAAQIDRFGNQNIACIGDPDAPTVQLLGPRGAPGNTINHPTSYWVPRHSPRVFVERVDFVSGVGYDRAAAVGARFHEIRGVVTNLAVLDFSTPTRTMRLASVHPGVAVAEVIELTGFELVVGATVPTTRRPTDEEQRLLRTVIDPDGTREREVST